MLNISNDYRIEKCQASRHLSAKPVGSLHHVHRNPIFSHIQSFPKETFLKLRFFWRRVYTSESGVMHHFRKPICRFLMTPCYMTLTLGPRKNPRRKVAFLLGKTVQTVTKDLNGIHCLFVHPSTLNKGYAHRLYK